MPVQRSGARQHMHWRWRWVKDVLELKFAGSGVGMHFGARIEAGADTAQGAGSPVTAMVSSSADLRKTRWMIYI